MKTLLWIIATLLTALAIYAAPTYAATLLFPTGGGTGSTTLSGILIGAGVSPVKTLTIGSGLSLTGTTLSATGGSSASSTLLGDTNTFSGTNNIFTHTLTLTGLLDLASSTIGDGTQKGGLTISGGATTTQPLTITNNQYPNDGLIITSAAGVPVFEAGGSSFTVPGGAISTFSGRTIVQGDFLDVQQNLLTRSGTLIGSQGGVGATTNLVSDIADGASAIVLKLNSLNTLANSGAKLFSVQNNGAEKFFVSALGTASTTNLIVSSAGGSGTRCAQFAADGTISAAVSACGVGGSSASSTLLGDTNTFSGTDIFSNTLKVASLSGFIGGNGGTLYNFATSTIKTSQLTNDAGFLTSAVTSVGATYPLSSSGGATPTISTAFGTTSNTGIAAGSLYIGSGGIFQSTATTTASCTGNATCSAFTIFGTSPVTINVAAGTAASSTLLTDANTFSGVDKFTNASSDFSGTWQTFSPAHFLTAAITALGPTGQTQTGATQTLATSSATTISGLTVGLTIVGNTNTQTFTPTFTGSISGLTTANFSSANISQWTNNSNYITLASLSGSYPVTYNSGTGAIGFSGLATTSPWTQGQLAYVVNNNTITSTPTTTVTCTGSASCTSFVALGPSPITINVAAGTAASSTLLGDTNTFSGTDSFTHNITTLGINGAVGSALTISPASGRTLTLQNNGGTGALDVFNSGVIAAAPATSLGFEIADPGGSDAIFDTSHLSTNQTYAFPNVTGTFGIGVSTTSGQLAYWGGDAGLRSAATTSVTCTGNATCTGFTALGSSPVTINVAAGTAASSTLLGDTNTFSGTDIFSNPIKIASLNGLIGGNNGTTYAVSTSSLNASITGNAGTATALLSAPTKCSSGFFNLGIDASGNAQNCTYAFATTTPWTTGLVGIGSAGAGYTISTTSLNASITGSAGSVANSVTFNSSGSGGASPQAFNGSSAVTISYNTIGAQVAGSYESPLTFATPNIRTGNTINWVGLATTSQPSSSNLLTSNGGAGVYGTATSTLTPTSPLGGSFTQVGTGGSITCTTAASGVAGCLSSTAFDIFNNKQAALSTPTWPIKLTGTTLSFGWATTSQPSSSNLFVSDGASGFYGVATGTVSAGSSAITVTAGRAAIGGALAIDCATAGSGQNGCLSSTDWSTFNGKDSFAWPFTATTFGSGVIAAATSSVLYPSGLVTGTSTIGALAASSSITNQSVKSALVLNSATGLEGAYTGSNPCTNQVALSLSATGVISCTSVTNAMLSNSTISGVALGGTLAAHSHDTSLTGTSYTGTSAVSDWGLNLAHGNTWTALQQFSNASSSLLSVYNTAYFGTTATTTIDGTGNIVIPSGSNLTITGKGDGCATFASGVLNSTGSSCGGVGSSQWNTVGNNIWYPNGNVGIATDTPYALFSIAATSTTGTNSPTTLFAIASSTAGTATTTIFSISNTGNIILAQDSIPSNRSIIVDTQQTAAKAGNRLNIKAGIGSTTGVGGVLDLRGGNGGSTGSGGSLFMFGGTAGSSGNGTGGATSLSGGDGAGTGSGGLVANQGGQGGSSNGAGGTAALIGGTGIGSGAGGDTSIQGGAAGVTGNGGSVNITARPAGSSGGNGGSVLLTAGKSSNVGGNGGNIVLLPGDNNGAGGTQGIIKLKDPASLIQAVLDTSDLSSSDKTFTFPNTTGTFALGTGATGGLSYWSSTNVLSNLANSFVSAAANWIGLGTTTPQWLLQLATSTAPQLALTSNSSSGNFHWTFNNIFGNLFLATSSATTFATSTNSDPNTGYIEFPNNGGCVGCTDIVLPNGINLRNAQYVDATTTNVAANTLTDVYTAPAGRRALVRGASMVSFAGTSIAFSSWLKDSGTYYRLTATSTASSLNASHSIGYILDPGESIAVDESVAASNLLSYSIIEFDSSVPFFSAKKFAIGTATTTIYTTPTNVTASVLNCTSPDIPTATTVSACGSIANVSGTVNTVNGMLFGVKSGQIASLQANAMAAQSAPTTYGINTLTVSSLRGAGGAYNRNSGDSIQFSTTNNTSFAANSVLWIDVVEH